MIKDTIEKLLAYAKYHFNLSDFDIVFKRNELLHEFNLDEPSNIRYDIEDFKDLDTPTPLIEELRKDIDGIKDEEIERVMSIISLNSNETIHKFNELKNENTREALSYLYDFQIKNNYIKKDDIKRNMKWDFIDEYNYLEITINLSKPEKDNKDIAKTKTLKSSSYPKCQLCLENLGFYGGNGKNARSNIRVIPMKLCNEDFFFQFSPYAYYDEHAIIIKNEHVPMNINQNTIMKELDFLDQIPEYFIGSNSDLPIVGGSILDHEHFQAGISIMPMMKSRDRYILKVPGIKDTKISYLDWYNSTFKLVSKNKKELIEVSELIIKKWKDYNDKDSDIISFDNHEPHSTVTPIARKVDGNYEIFIILRNNRCNEKYPEGIFHAHSKYHNIKKEGIGLIEAMGLFILPPRLKNELSLISNLLSDDNSSVREYILANPSLEKHLDFINRLVLKYGRRLSKEASDEIVKIEVGKVCKRILKNTAVFKDNIDGQIALFNFFNRIQFEVVNDE